MARQARLDAPGILHHAMVRGLERCPIFRDDVDRRDFCIRLGGLMETTTLTVYAWTAASFSLRWPAPALPAKGERREVATRKSFGKTSL